MMINLFNLCRTSKEILPLPSIDLKHESIDGILDEVQAHG